MWLFVSVLASGGTLAGLTNTKVFQVPVFVILWGFLGGVAWCLYGAAYWSNRRLFDSHYFPWYIAHPWISAVLGAVMALLILGGLSSLGTFDPTTDVGVALLSVVSFVAGFSTHKFWKLLDRSVAKLLGEKESERTIQEEAEKALTPSKP